MNEILQITVPTGSITIGSIITVLVTVIGFFLKHLHGKIEATAEGLSEVTHKLEKVEMESGIKVDQLGHDMGIKMAEIKYDIKHLEATIKIHNDKFLPLIEELSENIKKSKK